MNEAICLECGYKDDINSFNITPMDEGDPNPVIECPKCGGCAEFYTEGLIAFIERTKDEPRILSNDLKIDLFETLGSCIKEGSIRFKRPTKS